MPLDALSGQSLARPAAYAAWVVVRKSPGGMAGSIAPWRDPPVSPEWQLSSAPEPDNVNDDTRAHAGPIGKGAFIHLAVD
jgi:hypothetical protein